MQSFGVTASIAPRCVANAWARPWIDMIFDLRRRTRLTGAEIATQLGMPRSTVAGHLARAGIGRLRALEPQEPVRRYERARPGELIHLDVKKLGRFERPGHRVTGQRKGNRNRGAGWDHVHVCIDDCTRLAYVEVLPDETRRSTTGFLVRAIRWFRRHGVSVERVMTDNGSGYVAKLFAKACRILGIRHIRTRPYTPKTNGKAERFIQTMLREWAYAIPYASSERRNADLPRWIDHYNSTRPHGSLGGAPPATKLAFAL